MRFSSFLLTAALLSSANAQANALLEVYHSARQTDPTYQAALAEAAANSETQKQAIGALLPQLNSSAYINSTDRDATPADPSNPASASFNPSGSFDTQGYSVILTQSIVRFDQFASLAIGSLTAKQAEVDVLLAEQELVARAAEAYFAFLAAKTDLATAKAERDAINSQLEQAQKRFEVGLIASVDVQEAQASFDLADAQLIAAEQALENAKDIMREIAGQQIDDLPDLKANIPMQAPAGDDQSWVERAMTNNPQLVRSKLGVAIADKNIAAQRAGHLPALSAQAEYAYRDTTDFGTSGAETTDTLLSLQLSLPLFSGGSTQSKVRQASQQKLQAEHLAEQARRSVERETRAAYRSMVSAIRRVQALEQAVQSNQTALEATQAGYDVGTRTSVDVLNARSGLFRAQRDYAKSRYDYALSLIRLYRAEGTLGPNHLVVLNGWLESSLSDAAANLQ
jgi:outer membrane protein